MREQNNSGAALINPFTSTINVYEECCNEKCDTEEMNEIINPPLHSDLKRVSVVVRNNLHSYVVSYLQ